MNKFLLCLTLLLGLTSCTTTYVTRNSKLLDQKYTAELNEATAIHLPLIRLKIGQGSCSGFVISDYYALTAGHCVSDENGLTNLPIDIYSTTNEKVVTAKAASMDYRRDIGLIRGDFKLFKKAPVRYKDSLMSGWSMQFFGCGFPEGTKKEFCEPFKVSGLDFFYISGMMPMFPGMSGGPVFDLATGEVLGIMVHVKRSVGDNAVITPLIAFDAALGIENDKE